MENLKLGQWIEIKGKYQFSLNNVKGEDVISNYFIRQMLFILILLVSFVVAPINAYAIIKLIPTNGPGGASASRISSFFGNGKGYSIVEEKVYKTTDGGTTWSETSLNPSRYLSNIILLKYGNVVAGQIVAGDITDTAIYLSTDDGLTWTSALTLHNAAVRSFVQLSDNSIYAAVTNHDAYENWGGIYKSSDHGLTWSRISMITPVDIAVDNNDVMYAADSSNIVYKSNDKGINWYPIALNPDGILSNIVCGQTGEVYVAASNKFHASLDGGDTWPIFFSFSSINGHMSLITDITVSSTAVYVGLNESGYSPIGAIGVYKSTNKGTTWSSINNGFVSQNINFIKNTNEDDLFSGTNDGIYKFNQSLIKWELKTAGLVKTTVESIAASRNNIIYAASYNNGLFKSSDQGATWIKTNIAPELYVSALAVDNINNVYIGTRNAMYKSTDNGLNWVNINNYFWVDDIKITSTGLIFAKLHYGGIKKSYDGGLTWSDTAWSGQGHQMFIDGNDNLFLVSCKGNNGVYVSKDNGSSWQSLSNMCGESIGIDSTGIIYVGQNQGGLYKSTDNGQTWRYLGFHTFGDEVNAVLIDNADNVYIDYWEWYGYQSSGLFFSSDKGESWQQINETPVMSLALDSSGTIYAGVTGAGVYKSIQSIKDTDNDGMPDDWESANNLNPNDPADAGYDNDSDGLTNLEEYNNGTDPNNPDSDGDGMPDGWEVKYGFNPKDPNDASQDADNDGLTNIDEYKYGFDPKVSNQGEGSITPQGLTVSIGGTNKYEVIIKNVKPSPEKYTLTIEGLDNSWYSLSDANISIIAGEEKNIRLDIHIPVNCGIAPQDYPFNVRVTPTYDGLPFVIQDTLTVVHNPIITSLLPDDGETMGLNRLNFSWTSDAPGTTEVFYKKEGETQFTSVAGSEGTAHSLNIENLSWNTQYQWYVRTAAACGNSQSALRSSFIDTGIVFLNDPYDFSIERDYEQVRTINVKNIDINAHSLLISIINENDDLVAGFRGDGSMDQTITLQPDETKAVQVAFHAQDAEKTDYTVKFKISADADTPHPIVTYTDAFVHVRQTVFNLSLTQISSDPFTLTNTYRITNNGDTVTDLTVDADEVNRAFMTFNPAIQHMRLGKGESVDFIVLAEGQFDATIIASAMGAKKTLNTHYGCVTGTQAFTVKVDHPQICSYVKGWYCTNRPNIQLPFALKSGLAKTDISRAGLFSQFVRMSGNVKNHDVDENINNDSVLSLRNIIPDGIYSAAFPPSYLNYSRNGNAGNKIRINSRNMNGAHYQVMTDHTIALALKTPVETMVCAVNESEAEITAKEKINGLSCNVDLEALNVCPNVTNVQILNPDTGKIKSRFSAGDKIRFALNVVNPDTVEHVMNLKIHLDNNPNDATPAAEISQSVIVPADGAMSLVLDSVITDTLPVGTILVNVSLNDASCQDSTGYVYSFTVTDDRDGDGLKDTNDPCPDVVDCDGDGLTDYEEVCYDGACNIYNPYDTVSNPTGADTDANKQDTDGDGWNDYEEKLRGTSAVDPLSFPLGSISGHVYGDRNGNGGYDEGEGIKGAKVTVTATAGCHYYPVPIYSGDNGYFTMGNLPGCSYEVKASWTDVNGVTTYQSDPIKNNETAIYPLWIKKDINAHVLLVKFMDESNTLIDRDYTDHFDKIRKYHLENSMGLVNLQFNQNNWPPLCFNFSHNRDKYDPANFGGDKFKASRQFIADLWNDPDCRQLLPPAFNTVDDIVILAYQGVTNPNANKINLQAMYREPWTPDILTSECSNMPGIAIVATKETVLNIGEDILISEGSIGAWAHETGHGLGDILAGGDDLCKNKKTLPDLYDKGNVDTWDLMGHGFVSSIDDPEINRNQRLGSRPDHMSSFNKKWLGWMDFSLIKGESGEYDIPALETHSPGDKILIYQVSHEGTQIPGHFYMFEVRNSDTRLSYWDQSVPETGLILYLVRNNDTDEFIVNIPGWNTDNKKNDAVLAPPGNITEKFIDFRHEIEITPIKENNDLNSLPPKYSIALKVSPIETPPLGTIKGIILDPNIDVYAKIQKVRTVFAQNEKELLPDLDLHLYTDDGQHVGINYVTGIYEQGISAYSSGDLFNDAEWILVPYDMTGLHFVISSRDTGKYLEINPEVLNYTDGVDGFELYSSVSDPNATEFFKSQIITESIGAGTAVEYPMSSAQNTDGTYSTSLGTGSTFHDTTPPDTRLILSQNPTDSGWNNIGVTATLNATDDTYVALTEYSLDSGATWRPYEEPLIFNTPGITEIQYRSYDNFDHIEDVKTATIKVDLSGPEDFTISDEGVYSVDNSSILINCSASDTESGISGYAYRIGTAPELGDVQDWTVAASTCPQRLPAALSYDQKYYVCVKAINNAGSETNTLCTNGITILDPLADPDKDGFTNQEEVNAQSDPFNADSTPGITTLTLHKGFNLVSFPAETLYYENAYNLMSSLGGHDVITKVLIFDAETQTYDEAGYNGAGQFHGQNIALPAGQGIAGMIIYAKEDATFTFTSKFCHTWNLKAGTNFVGTPCAAENLTAFGLMQNIGDDTVITSIQRYDNETGIFETAGYINSQLAGVNFPIKAGEGYFVNMKEDVTGFKP